MKYPMTPSGAPDHIAAAHIAAYAALYTLAEELPSTLQLQPSANAEPSRATPTPFGMGSSPRHD